MLVSYTNGYSECDAVTCAHAIASELSCAQKTWHELQAPLRTPLAVPATAFVVISLTEMSKPPPSFRGD